MRKKINRRLARPIIGLIRVYQRTLSPDKSLLFSPFLKGRVCAHHPHCSAYSIQVLKKYGLFPGAIYMTDRVTSCTASSTIKHDPATLRVVFASSAPIGVPFLQKIASDSRYDLVGVVTNPDQPVGRGLKVRPNIIKKTAQEIDCNEIQTPHSLRPNSKKYSEEAKEFKQRLTNKQPDLLVVIAYGKIIPQDILDIPAIAPINVHGSLLPTYRGASPIQSVLLDDQKQTGITIMKMEAGLDTGPMLSKKVFPLTIHTTALDIIEKFQKFGPKQLVDTVRDYAKGHISEQAQDDTVATHCTKLEKTHGIVDPRSDSLHHVNNIYRGCYLWPKAHFTLPEGRGEHIGKIITIDKIKLDEPLRENNKSQPLIDKNNNLNPAVIELKVKPVNSKSIYRSDFLNGYQHP